MGAYPLHTPWQRKLVGDLFGWKRRDGTRKYRRAYIEVPRKNGKSTIGAGIALYLLFADGEYGADAYSAAADRHQAAIVFETAKQMVELSPLLKPRAELFKRSIFCPENMGSYKVLSADAFTKHGLNPHGIIFDELHAQPNRDLWDVLNTGMGARRQPLMVMITTAGFDRTSICWEQRSYGLAVQQGRMDDPGFYTYISAADETDDWLDPKVWAKANPNLDVTVSSEYIATESARAVPSPAYQNTFRRLHLNQWTQQESRWLDMRAWDACNAPLPALSGRVCYAGLDLASTTDIAALVLAFPPEGDDEPTWLLPFFWIPQENLVERSRRDRVPYAAWLRDGLVCATPWRWMADNVTVEQDATGNVKPSKGKSREKIDGIVACIMGLDRALRRAAVGSVYDQRGVLEL